MKRVVIIAWPFFVLLVPACLAPVPQANWSNPQTVASRIEMTRDGFKKQTQYEGPNCATDLMDWVFLRTWRYDRTAQ